MAHAGAGRCAAAAVPPPLRMRIPTAGSPSALPPSRPAASVHPALLSPLWMPCRPGLDWEHPCAAGAGADPAAGPPARDVCAAQRGAHLLPHPAHDLGRCDTWCVLPPPPPPPLPPLPKLATPSIALLYCLQLPPAAALLIPAQPTCAAWHDWLRLLCHPVPCPALPGLG